MKIHDIILEVNPVSAFNQGRAAAGNTGVSAMYRGQQKGAMSNDDMQAGRFAAMAKQKKQDALKQQQAATNQAKSQQRGEIGQFAQQKAQMKGMQNGVVTDPTGMHYQFQQDEKGNWAWRNVEIKLGNKPQPGQFLPYDKVVKNGDVNIEPMPGTYPLKDKDQLSLDLTAIAKGVEPTQSTMGAMKDRAVQAMGGPLASKTMADPEATTGQKAGAVAGAALGRAAGKALGSLRPQVAEPRKDPTRTAAAFDLETPKNKILDKNRSPEEKIAAAEELLKNLQAQQAKNVNVDKYVDAMGPMLKASGLNKAQPQWYAQFVQKARAMRMEAFEFMNKVLEYWDMTWEDIGYKVVLSENASDDVLIFPTKAINEAVEIEKLQKLAGV